MRAFFFWDGVFGVFGCLCVCVGIVFWFWNGGLMGCDACTTLILLGWERGTDGSPGW